MKVSSEYKRVKESLEVIKYLKCFFRKRSIPASFVYASLFQKYMVTVDFSGIRTRFVRLEGEDIDH